MTETEIRKPNESRMPNVEPPPGDGSVLRVEFRISRFFRPSDLAFRNFPALPGVGRNFAAGAVLKETSDE